MVLISTPFLSPTSALSIGAKDTLKGVQSSELVLLFLFESLSWFDFIYRHKLQENRKIEFLCFLNLLEADQWSDVGFEKRASI